MPLTVSLASLVDIHTSDQRLIWPTSMQESFQISTTMWRSLIRSRAMRKNIPTMRDNASTAADIHARRLSARWRCEMSKSTAIVGQMIQTACRRLAGAGGFEPPNGGIKIKLIDVVGQCPF
jgi:hypothetical protein